MHWLTLVGVIRSGDQHVTLLADRGLRILPKASSEQVRISGISLDICHENHLP